MPIKHVVLKAEIYIENSKKEVILKLQSLNLISGIMFLISRRRGALGNRTGGQCGNGPARGTRINKERHAVLLSIYLLSLLTE
jgi:hypothetical protein